MKTLLILIITIMIAQAETNMVDKINQTLDQIRYENSKKNTVNLDIKYDPFFHNTKQKITDDSTQESTILDKTALTKTVKEGLQLSMILNNKAFINGKWYSKNQKLEHYVLSKINQDSVVLRKKNKTIVLKLKTIRKLLEKKEVI